MARHGRQREAAAIIAPLIHREATLATFVAGLVAAGILETSAGAGLLKAEEVRAS